MKRVPRHWTGTNEVLFRDVDSLPHPATANRDHNLLLMRCRLGSGTRELAEGKKAQADAFGKRTFEPDWADLEAVVDSTE